MLSPTSTARRGHGLKHETRCTVNHHAFPVPHSGRIVFVETAWRGILQSMPGRLREVSGDETCARGEVEADTSVAMLGAIMPKDIVPAVPRAGLAPRHGRVPARPRSCTLQAYPAGRSNISARRLTPCGAVNRSMKGPARPRPWKSCMVRPALAAWRPRDDTVSPIVVGWMAFSHSETTKSSSSRTPHARSISTILWGKGSDEYRKSTSNRRGRNVSFTISCATPCCPRGDRR